MAFPADFFLPAKSVYRDGPVPAGDQYYEVMTQQLEGARLMINERINGIRLDGLFSPFFLALVPPLPALPAPPVRWLAATINTYRQKVEAILNQQLRSLPGTPNIVYVNTANFPLGNFFNATVAPNAATVRWNKASIFAAAGVGIGGDWTRIPASNTYGYAPLAGDTLVNGDLMYKEHINELIQICNMMDVMAYMTNVSGFGSAFLMRNEARETRNSNPVNSFASCAAARANAIANWTANGYIGGGNTGQRGGTSTNGSGDFYAFIANVRGKIRADLSWMLQPATPSLWLYFAPFAASFYGNSPPFANMANAWADWPTAGLVSGANNLTAFVPQSEDMPDFDPFACPVAADISLSLGGWGVGDGAFDPFTVITGYPWVYKLP